MDYSPTRGSNRAYLKVFMLPVSFLGLFIFYHYIDYYRYHFFDSGLIVIVYNICRIMFALCFVWIIYASGYFITAILFRSRIKNETTCLERFILITAVGIGVWHAIMLILGILNLYYITILFGVVFFIVCLSATMFKKTLNNFNHELMVSFSQNPYSKTNCLLLMGSFFLLLLIKGLYPGGSSDYFTHYFYYNLSVIQNHGLAPNDVWYHFYYSKGTGLQFLAMILMDPEATAIMTCVYVFIAVLAIFDLISQLSPKSYWPFFAGGLYILFNLIPIKGDGGDFQKLHELTTALIVISTWAVCKYETNQKTWPKYSFIVLLGTILAITIITYPASILFLAFLITKSLFAIHQRNWQSLQFYTKISLISFILVLLVLLLNYMITGLMSDQVLTFSWKYANLEKLNKWGVIPNIIMIMWERHNYDLLAPAWSINTTFVQLLKFIRFDELFLLILFTTLAVIFTSSFSLYKKKERCEYSTLNKIKFDAYSTINQSDTINLQTEYKVIITLVNLIAAFAFVSILAGHSQDISYFRFSSFFFPLIIILITTIWIIICKKINYSFHYLPFLLLIITITHWHHWPHKLLIMTKHSTNFLTGKYSLADAYQHLPKKPGFDGINLSMYAAFKNVPKGNRVWSTTLESYCMAPGCIIESVFSFKLSSRLNEILNEEPIVAKSILQSENLNYFIFTRNVKMYDILPYSKLFNPINIKSYFGIQWTDGNVYLLTWKENARYPIGDDFMKYYTHARETSNHPWFRFKELIPELNSKIQLINANKNSRRPVSVTWP